MNQKEKKVRGLGLCSGGLDSILAALVLKEQGIHVDWITFETPFFSADKAKLASNMTGVPLIIKNFTQDYLVMLKNPPCGYGKNMNPCLDCHSLMFTQAAKIMKQEGYDFLFSGEVMGQRPMSQTKPSLRYVEKNSSAEGYIIRPLSAKLLPESIPEKQGLVDREQLLNLSGRSRKPQIQLAKQFKIKDYPSPAGGCLLTDEGFSRRLKDLFDNGCELNEDTLNLLKYGRHLRLSPETRVVVGRNKADNDSIMKHIDKSKDFVFQANDIPGPVVVAPGGCEKNMTLLAGIICASYSKAPAEATATVTMTSPQGKSSLQVLTVPVLKFQHLMV